MRRLLAMLLIASAISRAAAAPAMPANPHAANAEWWKHAVLYEIYPRSFADSNDDGIGDIRGITSHVDYLRSLGVDAVWLTPMFPSPQKDFGYDVADYDAVDPQFGTVGDVDTLIADGKRKGIKLILDLVVNHTSNQHRWFQQSAASRDNPYRDFYVWRDGKDGGPPNNWTSLFGGSAWTKDARTGQYYYHFFYPEQPDLNWRDPEVERAMFDAASWWLKRGVYGYRLDAVDTMFETPDLRDNPPAPGTDDFGLPNQDRLFNTRLPQVHTELQRLRAQVIDKYPGRILVGETWTAGTADLVAYYGPHNDELQLPMFLNLMALPSLDAATLRTRIDAVEANAVGGWPCFALSNHDKTRVASRLPIPAGATSDDLAKITGALLLTVRGTPVLYYGEELGMLNNDPKRIEDVQDIIGKKGWPKEKGRDGERTPMQWTGGVNAGFNAGAKPWLPVGPDAQVHNVAREGADPASVLSLYRSLIAERRSNPAFDGVYRSVDRADPQVFAFRREGGGKAVVVLLNFDTHPADVPMAAIEAKSLGRVIASNRAQVTGATVHLEPLGMLVAAAD